MSLYQLPKELHPDFRPNVKPGGEVEIDWSNKFARGLKVCLIATNSGPIELVNGGIGTDAESGTVSFGVKEGETCHSGTEDAFYTSISSPVLDSDRGYTMFSRFYNRDWSSNEIQAAICATTALGNMYFMTRAAGTIRAYTSDTDGAGKTIMTSSTNFSSTAKWFNCIARHKTSDGVLYVDQAQEGTDTGDTTWTPSAVLDNVSMGGRNYNSAGFSLLPVDASQSMVCLWDWGMDDNLLKEFNLNPFQILKPKVLPFYFIAAAAAASATVTGTATASITETDVVNGGKTIIITLTGDTFKAAGTGPIGSTADTQALINNIDSAQAEATGWDAVVKVGIETADVTRDSSTQATITLDPESTYDITAQETITVTVPTDVLVTAAGAITATPTFTVDTVAGIAIPVAMNAYRQRHQFSLG